MLRLSVLFSLVLTLPVFAGDLQLTLPPRIYAVPGVPMGLWHDNLVLTENPAALRYEFKTDLGTAQPDHWQIEAQDKDVGEHALEVIVRSAEGKELERARSTITVVPRKAGAGKPLRVLIIGDSLTHASLYPNEMARLCAGADNPQLTLFGTHRPPAAKPGVAHEGYGGWKWADFLTKYAPQPAGTTAGPLAKKTTSPFLFPDAQGKPVLDLPRYFREACDNQPPDVVTFLLGINDCFAAKPEAPDDKITEVLANAEKLLAAFHQAAPQAILAIGLTTPPNARQSGFTANYKTAYTRWGWKRIQHRLVQRMIQQLSGREKDRLYLVPTELNLDPVAGYSDNNGVHPNPTGYAQIGASFFCFLKSIMPK